LYRLHLLCPLFLSAHQIEEAKMRILRSPERLRMNRACLTGLLISLAAFFFAVQAIAIEIPLQKQGGVYSLPVRINGVITLKFILDSGASEVAIPADVAMTLIRAGTITDNDFLPGKSYKLADGSELKSARLILREMEFGGIKISNVTCSVTPPAGDLLLGQSLLEKLHSWKLDNNRHVLIVDSATDSADKSSRPKRSTPYIAFDDALAAYKRGDFAKAYKEFTKLAEQGNAPAQFYLGMTYYGGYGVPQDYAEALKWLRKAAERENADAQFILGMMYAKGKGVPQDYVQAADWYRKAAEQGNTRAQAFLGLMYHDGEGITQDYAEATKWFRKAAEQGDADAQGLLGLMYHDGEGVPKDYAEAAKWYRMAAEQGYALAQFNLGFMYHNGQGVTRNYAEAAKWYREAADQSDMGAQYNLGAMYTRGEGVPQDFVLAHMWFNLAAAQGGSAAQKGKDLVAEHMTPSQIAEAQRLAREWKPKGRD